MSSLILPNDDAPNVINPIHRHIFSSGEAGPIMALACATFQMGEWRRRRREAEERNDFAMLDRLDREYELIGLP